ELKPQFVASHGQTIFHQPEKTFTAQIGDGETMVRYLDCPLVCNFRNKDVAHGGQGAPLVPFGEKWLFPDYRHFLNLGGFANLTVGETAFDVAPCNMALNWLTSTMVPPLAYDADGALARAGEMNYELYEALEQLDWYQLPPPKSLGTEWFEAQVLPLISNADLPVQDRLKTYVMHVVSRVTVALRDLEVREAPLVITGGGAHNGYLIEELARSVAGLGISVAEVPTSVIDFKEAIIFAFLGLNTLLGRPNIVAEATGADKAVTGGSIHLPPGGWAGMAGFLTT
ncbi:MAG: anhydro-N-acetylmuramic acid kinase, partial [Bacteroidota bacterium]